MVKNAAHAFLLMSVGNGGIIVWSGMSDLSSLKRNAYGDLLGTMRFFTGDGRQITSFRFQVVGDDMWVESLQQEFAPMLDVKQKFTRASKWSHHSTQGKGM